MDKKKRSLTSVLLMIGFLPLILSSAVICLLLSNTITKQLEADVYQKLYVASDGLRQYYQYDLEQGQEIEYEHDYVDMFKSDGIEMTLFIGDTRLMTSALNDSGQRNEGTKMAADIWAKVQAGQSVQADGVNIGGQDYYVYYMPLRDASNKVVGASWAGQSEANVKASIRKVLFLLIGVAVVSMVVFAVVIYFVAAKVRQSIDGVIADVETLSSGDLMNDKQSSSAIREIDAIGNNVKSLVIKLREIVGAAKDASTETGKQSIGLTESITQITDTTDAVSTAIREIAEGVMDQAEAIQRATANVGNLSDAIQIVADNTETLSDSAMEMHDASQQSSEALQTLIGKMDVMDQTVKDIAVAMEDTNNAVNSVNEKVDGITSIATQTNLLALNASIEAARAGEAGKGFAVVAEEIGKLATESAQTAQEIRAEMSQLLTHAKGAGEKTTEIITIGDDVKTVLNSTADTINALITNVDSTVAGVNTISGLMDDCNNSKNEIVDAMSSLSAISEENAASTEETDASMSELNSTMTNLKGASQKLSSVAEKLDSELSFFKV